MISLDPVTLAALDRDPRRSVGGRLNGSAFTARIAIADYGSRIERHFGRSLSTLDVGFPFRHFGLSIDFEKPVELAVHDEERRLDPGLRALLDRFGPLTFRNAHLRDRTLGQRNVFQSLSFHIDRGSPQEDTTSLFWRDPFDPDHRQPRSSSTLVLANAAAYFQAVREGGSEHTFKRGYKLFKNEDIASLVDELMVELSWRAPAGTGEVALVDNLTTLHASYYPHPESKGYPIAVRYLF